jgi:hypothetical protein
MQKSVIEIVEEGRQTLDPTMTKHGFVVKISNFEWRFDRGGMEYTFGSCEAGST